MDARKVTLTEKQLLTVLTALNEWETTNINSKVVASGPMRQGYENRLADIADARKALKTPIPTI